MTELASIFDGKIVDVGYDALTIMVAGESDKLDAFSDLAKPFGIVELQRTGPDRAGPPRPPAREASVGQDRPRLACRARAALSRREPMPATVYYDNDADTGLIADKLVAILGYGSQGHAHALNLKDSGIDVIVGLREGSKSKAKAEAAGLRVLPTGDAVREADIVMVLLPDTEQKKVYEADIAPNLVDGNSLAFAHGFNIHFKQIAPPAGRRRVDDRAEGPRPPRAPHLRRRRRRAVPRRGRERRDRQGQADRRSRTRRASAERAPACSTRRSRKRPRPTCSASRSCCAAGSSS